MISRKFYAEGSSLIRPAHDSHGLNPELDIDDVMCLAIGVSLGVYRDDAQRERVFQAVITGMGTDALLAASGCDRSSAQISRG